MSATLLLDLNLLLALAWPSHEHHDLARGWFKARGRKSWATCSFTQVGFVRLSSNPHVVDPPTTPARAAELLRRLVAHPHHVFMADDLDLQGDDWPPDWVIGHSQTTDAHLARLASRHGGRLATLDRPLSEHQPDVVELITPVSEA